MQLLTTITQKGQVTIPKRLRKQFGFDSNKRVSVTVHKQGVVIKPVEDILDLVGMFEVKKNKGRSVLEAREEMGKHYKRF